MLSAMDRSLSGVIAQRNRTDVVAHNIANVSTEGFQKKKTGFGELLYDSLQERRAPVAETANAQSGRGVRVNAVFPMFDQGALNATGDNTHLAVSGNGFMRVITAEGNYAYTRAGNFQVDAEGNLVTPRGDHLDPPLEMVERGIIPGTLEISAGGEIRGRSEEGEQIILGNLHLYRFTNSAALTPIESGLYEHNPGAGAIEEGTPGEEGFGNVEQGFLESSNVELSAEMVDLIRSQRSLQAGARALTTAEELWAVTLYQP